MYMFLNILTTTEWIAFNLKKIHISSTSVILPLQPHFKKV